MKARIVDIKSLLRRRRVVEYDKSRKRISDVRVHQYETCILAVNAQCLSIRERRIAFQSCRVQVTLVATEEMQARCNLLTGKTSFVERNGA